MLSITNLSKSYRKKQILSAIELQFNPGEIHGIVGENGAGKTTLFKCIAGLESHEGNIQYTSVNIKNTIGFLETNPEFLSKITGKEYLQLLCNARNIKDVNFEAQNIFELPLKQYAETYSTGMKKKLALTGVLLQNNNIFILDEPFNGVDIHSNLIIKELLKSLKEKGKIIVLSSHIFSTLEDTCDYLHYLKDEKIKKTVKKENFSIIENLMKDAGFKEKIKNFNIK
ncbi:ATP-binding cassette domain-containing protein [Kordia sp. YSTF-M3]|uniref:ATP-binding cassette domain-containing protein n=1 Tax=Kordia aestuariivivens TaxID=2759037 RepID=A0ABR7Q526_9FLAO|nr:ATP-binding cassette domain-containing protein [Kordia aestuariivivens]MBC8753669.1 ATP-binding cassette domain-containing protein [Kordia aestuariivivens]